MLPLKPQLPADCGKNVLPLLPSIVKSFFFFEDTLGIQNF